MKNNQKEKHSVFIHGEITSALIAENISKHSNKKDIGAHSIFLGQVRNDVINGKRVSAIEYSYYEALADVVFHEIRETAFTKFNLTCMHIYHSLGKVEAGKISLFVFTSAPHRKNAIDACTYIVEEIKSKGPVWGKEIMEDDTFSWKVNS